LQKRESRAAQLANLLDATAQEASSTALSDPCFVIFNAQRQERRHTLKYAPKHFLNGIALSENLSSGQRPGSIVRMMLS
jgi:hypothetical protein